MDPRNNPTDVSSQPASRTNSFGPARSAGSGEYQQYRDDHIFLSTGPARLSFIYRYMMALTPVFLVLLCIVARWILHNVFHVASSSLVSAVPGAITPVTNDLIGQYSSPIASATNITMLMIAPVGIFLLISVIGWTLRLDEVWMSAMLALMLSVAGGVLLAALDPALAAATGFVTLVLQWTAFFVQPLSIVAAVVVITIAEKFRRSIWYTIRDDGLWIRGGFFMVQEHMIPHHQIGRVVLEQDFLGSLFNYGTLIPHTTTRWGAETSLRGMGATGQKDNFGMGIGVAKAREEGSRYPLDCLYGIPDPKKAQKILTGQIHKRAMQGEEQVSILKKIYETGSAGFMAQGSGQQPAAAKNRTAPRAATVQEPGVNPKRLQEKPELDEAVQKRRQSPVVRVTESDPRVSPAIIIDEYTREIPPVSKNQQREAITRPSPSTTTPGESIPDQIRKLSELRDAGIITDEEFSGKKAELLKRI